MRSIVLSIDTQPRLDSTTNLVRYRRHKPEETSLYPIIEQHLPQFLGQIAEHGTHLPRFVTQEFDDYLKCGLLDSRLNGSRWPREVMKVSTVMAWHSLWVVQLNI